jgi:hypothetical protein
MIARHSACVVQYYFVLIWETYLITELQILDQCHANLNNECQQLMWVSFRDDVLYNI